jgi:hypothetical protein
MSQLDAVRIASITPMRDRAWLYKTDHARPIDRYIDFFGTPAPRRETLDPCGELVLERRA